MHDDIEKAISILELCREPLRMLARIRGPRVAGEFARARSSLPIKHEIAVCRQRWPEMHGPSIRRIDRRPGFDPHARGPAAIAECRRRRGHGPHPLGRIQQSIEHPFELGVRIAVENSDGDCRSTLLQNPHIRQLIISDGNDDRWQPEATPFPARRSAGPDGQIGQCHQPGHVARGNVHADFMQRRRRKLLDAFEMRSGRPHDDIDRELALADPPQGAQCHRRRITRIHETKTHENALNVSAAAARHGLGTPLRIGLRQQRIFGTGEHACSGRNQRRVISGRTSFPRIDETIAIMRPVREIIDDKDAFRPGPACAFKPRIKAVVVDHEQIGGSRMPPRDFRRVCVACQLDDAMTRPAERGYRFERTGANRKRGTPTVLRQGIRKRHAARHVPAPDRDRGVGTQQGSLDPV